jgi:hypothetical protein
MSPSILVTSPPHPQNILSFFKYIYKGRALLSFHFVYKIYMFTAVPCNQPLPVRLGQSPAHPVLPISGPWTWWVVKRFIKAEKHYRPSSPCSLSNWILKIVTNSGQKKLRTNSDMLVGKLGEARNNTMCYCGDRYELIQFPSHFNFLSLTSREIFLAWTLPSVFTTRKAETQSLKTNVRNNVYTETTNSIEVTNHVRYSATSYVAQHKSGW